MKTLFLTFLLLCSGGIIAQDTIYRTNGEVLVAKVIEITPTEVKLSKQQDGPIYVLSKQNVSRICFSDGTVDNFNQRPQPLEDVSEQLYTKGYGDAKLYYKGYKPASTATLLIGLLSPVAGLLPATIMGSSPPKTNSFTLPDSRLASDATYMRGYSDRAFRIKKSKIWSNLGIAVGINIGLLFYLAAVTSR